MGACSSNVEKKPAGTDAPKPQDSASATVPDAKTDGEPDLSQKGLLASDAELSANKAQFEELAKRFNVPASADVLAITQQALENKGFVVKVATDAADALAYLTSIPSDGQSINSGGSRTLDEIGYKDWAKTQTVFKDFKAEAIAAESKGDWGTAAAIRKAGSQSDVYFSSVAAITQDGALVWGSVTGTRVTLNAGKLVIIVGTQKIVKDESEANERLYSWQLPLESARARVVYKVPASSVNEFGTLRGVNPFAPKGSVHVVLVPGVWGF